MNGGPVWRVICKNPDCDWEVDVHQNDADFPKPFANARKLLHESQKKHPAKLINVADDRFESPEDGGMKLCGEVSCEKELQEWIEEFFEENGWTAIREVSPHGSNKRADLIVSHDEFGWFGIETKYMDGDGGRTLAEAHHQITRRYRGRKYIGQKIDRWAICPYWWGINSPDYVEKHQQQRDRATYTREFFGRHGIGYIDLDRWQMLIDFAYSKPWAKVPVGGEYVEQYYEDVNIEKIDGSVQNKIGEMPYRSGSA